MFFADEEGHATAAFTPVPGKTYRIHAAVFQKNGTLYSETGRTVETKELTWLGNDYGKEPVIVPPYVPMLRRDDTVSCLLRDYVFGKDGLPKQIIAAEGDLLAAPMTFQLLSGGKIMKGASSGFRFTKVAPERIELESEIEFPNLRIKLSAWMEYDGVLFYTAQLIPQGAAAVEKLTLVMPVKDASLFHFATGSIRAEKNYFYLSEFPGEDGESIWSSRLTRNTGGIRGNFLPFLWLGNFDRGLSFFAESDRGWVNDERRPCYQLRRTGGNTELLVNLISIPARLKAPRTVQFGVVANPVKPQPTGATAAVPQWSTNFGNNYLNAGLCSLDPFISNRMIDRTGKAAFLPYSAGNEYNYGDPEIRYFEDEIKRVPHKFYTITLNERPSMSMGPELNRYISMKSGWTQARVDFQLWRLKNLFDTTGIDGVYFDNSFPAYNFNIQQPGNGYIRDDGRIQGECAILLHREYLKRVAVLAHQYNRRSPRIVVHNTNAQVLPGFTFADVTYDGEMNIPPAGDHFDVFYPAWNDIMLAVPWGPTPGRLTNLGWWGKRAQQRAPNRAMFSIHKLYDLVTWTNGCDFKMAAGFKSIEEAFGTHAPDSRFVGYWKNDWLKAPPLKCSYFVRENKGALFYLANHERTPREVSFRLPPRYGIERGVLINRETGVILPQGENGEYRIRIPGHDLSVLEYKKQ